MEQKCSSSIESIFGIDEISMNKFESLLDARDHPEKYKEMIFRRDALIGLERCVGEVVTEMVDIIMGEGVNAEDAEMRLLLSVFPMFSDLFFQLYQADTSLAQQSLSNYKDYVKGPPNRPIPNPLHLKHVVLEFLKRFEDSHWLEQNKNGNIHSSVVE